MSKLGCRCGEVIRDNTDHLPYKGALFADTEFFELTERISVEVAAYIEARLRGAERQWLNDYFKSDTRPMSDDDLVHTIIARHLLHSHSDVYQCSKCGRILVERRDRSRRFDSFTPEDTPHRDIFQLMTNQRV